MRGRMVSKPAEHNLNLDIICTIEHRAVKHTVTRNTSLKHTAVEHTALENTRKGWCSVIYVQNRLKSGRDHTREHGQRDTMSYQRTRRKSWLCPHHTFMVESQSHSKTAGCTWKEGGSSYTQERPCDARIMITFLYSYLPLIVSMLKAPNDTM